ncbi:hypothetical protein [Streptacidiphilus carbonis]|uniref:hypothetical protein n=1 Tax=Streptacidiphilus carbonis TaxID=105422 RepID=UPI0005A67F9A
MHAQIVPFDGLDPLGAVAPHEVLYAGGTASGGREVPFHDIALSDIALNGGHLTWRQATPKAGRLPASRVTGRRRTVTPTRGKRP